MPRRNRATRTGSSYWTVQYVRGNATVNVGHALTDVELLQQIINQPKKYPTGGKLIKIRGDKK